MAVIKVKETKVKKVLIVNEEQLLELAEGLAEGLSDAILEFYIAKRDIPEEVLKPFEDFKDPDIETEAGIDNEYYEDLGEI